MKKAIMMMALVPLLASAPAFASNCHEGHSGNNRPAAAKKKPAAAKKAEAAYRKVTKAEIGKSAVCPVTGEKLRIAKDTVSMSYKGKKYYFCCPGCDKSFKKAPEKYAVKEKAAAKKYVCPMGDYEGDKPGKCPKCGMTLVEKKAEKKQEKAHRKYVCPMGCAESDKPEKCPKCGMDMKERKQPANPGKKR
ncbi:MAG: heavy metal-binding domain-containing protein [Elusimicrobiales bacterium]|nr:heavy metal-binding domain-containing protein [Elusimicrobiales bacterium]